MNDNQFEEKVIDKVDRSDKGFFVGFDGQGIFVESPPIKPKIGMKIKIYGEGLGFPVRGIIIDGVKCYYRTKEEDLEYREIQTYGADTQDWLNRWDKGEIVWSISMGGLGPAYEQCIQITTAEIVRHMLDKKYDHEFWEDSEKWKEDLEKISEHTLSQKVIKDLGLSGAQWGAAVNLACHLYQKGPRQIMKDKQVKDRHIQVKKDFPG